MIGGYDFIFSIPRAHGVMEGVLRYFRGVWPHCVADWDDTQDLHLLVDTADWEAAAAQKELYIYRDSESHHIWSEEGQSPRAWNQMAHVILEEVSARELEVAVVVDELDSEMQRILEGLKSFLKAKIPPPMERIA